VGTVPGGGGARQRVFSRIRVGLVEQFGLDPGTSLRRTHLEILNG
jgi:hypothetical protein